MQYHLDTIPVWEAMEQSTACPLCALYRRVEASEIERSLGGSVMEPDARIRVNEKGICARHHGQLFAMQNRLGHALLVDSHTKELLKKLEEREITLPSATWYALQLGAFESETAAQELGQQFVKRGAAGYVWHDGRYRTLAAVYPSREDAQAVREQLSEAHSVDSYLYQIDLPALHLLMKGMKGQLDILEAAFAHANDLVANLQEASVAMDRQEMSGEEAAQLLNGLGEQVSTVSLRLQQRFSAPRHQTVEGLIACFEDYASFLETLDAADSDATFSMKLKRQTLSTLNHLKGVYDALGNT